MKSEYRMSQLETHVHSPTGEVLQSLSMLILVLYDKLNKMGHLIIPLEKGFIQVSI